MHQPRPLGSLGWGAAQREPPPPASAGFLGEQCSHVSHPDPHRLLQPACAWTPCWWPRTGPCSSAHPPPTVCTGVALRSCALPRTPKPGKRTLNWGFSLLGTYDSFFLAPEVAEQELVTEKASGRPLSLPTPTAPMVPPSAQSRGWGRRCGPSTGPRRGRALPQCSGHLQSLALLARVAST